MSLDLPYAQSAYNQKTCNCGAHRLHQVFRYFWKNPSEKKKDAARALKMKEENLRGAIFRLRKKDLTKLCPECFFPKLLGGVCQNCGFEPEASLYPLEVRADSQSPTNNLLPGNELGTEVDYYSIGFVNHGMVLKRRMERGIEDSLIVGVKSDVENELKRTFPSEAITDEAGRLVIKEVKEFRARYPGLSTSKNVRRQLGENVMNRLCLLHPQLRHVTVLPPEVGP